MESVRSYADLHLVQNSLFTDRDHGMSKVVKQKSKQLEETVQPPHKRPYTDMNYRIHLVIQAGVLKTRMSNTT